MEEKNMPQFFVQFGWASNNQKKTNKNTHLSECDALRLEGFPIIRKDPFPKGTFTYIYHKDWLIVGEYTTPMHHMGLAWCQQMSLLIQSFDKIKLVIKLDKDPRAPVEARCSSWQFGATAHR